MGLGGQRLSSSKNEQIGTRDSGHSGTLCFMAVLLLINPSFAVASSTAKNVQNQLAASNAAMLVAPATAGVVGAVSITNSNIFDLSDPQESGLLYRLANQLHIRTQPEVIQQQLLLQPGDFYSEQAVQESERILRQNRYIQEASVVAIPRENGVVDLDVTTSDVWTLMPKLSFSRSGGASNTTIGIKETNLLGRGIAVEAAYKSDPDRDAKILKFNDRNIAGSWYGMSALYSSNSDGHDYGLGFGKPFYSMDARNSKTIGLQNFDRVDSFYTRGDVSSEYRHEASIGTIAYGWSKGLQDNWVRRFFVGFVSDEHTFSDAEDSLSAPGLVPDDRKLRYPFVGIEIVENRFEKTRNYDQMNRTEDRFLGTQASARLGFAQAGHGSDRDALIINMQAQTGFGSSANKQSLLLASGVEGRLEQGGMQNLALTMSAKYFKRYSERSLLHVSISGLLGQELDLDQQVQLGGDSGLRGYPLRYQTGDSSVLLTVEHRFFTDWYPFRLFHVGAAAFFDAGRTWGSTAASVSDNEILRDVGFGLRLGNNRSGIGRMIHIDVAFPLDGSDDIDNMQFLISTKKSF